MKVIIVPGQNPHNKGNLPASAVAKVKHACSLYEKGDFIIMSGKWGLSRKKPAPVTESKLMKSLAIDFGIPKSSIILEEKSMDTLGNAYFSKKILEKNDCKNVVIIVLQHNRDRCKFIFSKILGSDYNIKFTIAPFNFDKDELNKLISQDKKIFVVVKKLLSYDVEELFTKIHPAYVKNSALTIEDIKIE